MPGIIAGVTLRPPIIPKSTRPMPKTADPLDIAMCLIP